MALAIACAGIALGAVHLSFHDAAARRARKAVGVALAAAGLFAVTNWVLTPKASLLQWFDHEEQALAEATTFVLLRVDLTNEDADPALGRLKGKYHVDTLPAVRVATAAGATLGGLNEFMPPDAFLTEIARIRALPATPPGSAAALDR